MMSQTVWTWFEAPGFRGPMKVERECPAHGSDVRSIEAVPRPRSHRLHDRGGSSCYASATRSL